MPKRKGKGSSSLKKPQLKAAAQEVPSEQPGASGQMAEVEAAVDIFYQKVMADPQLEPFFRHLDMTKQRHKISNFMLYIMGGSEAYTGRDLYTVHTHMVEEQGLRRRHFDLVLEHMHAVLEELGAPDDMVAQALANIQATLPLFRFPPDEGGSASGSTGGGPTTELAAAVERAAAEGVLPPPGSPRAYTLSALAPPPAAAMDPPEAAAELAPPAMLAPGEQHGGGSIRSDSIDGEWVKVRLELRAAGEGEDCCGGGSARPVSLLLLPATADATADADEGMGSSTAEASAAVSAAAHASPKQASAGGRGDALGAVQGVPLEDLPAAEPSAADNSRLPSSPPLGGLVRRGTTWMEQVLAPSPMRQCWNALGAGRGATLAVGALAAAAAAAHLAAALVPVRRGNLAGWK